MNITDPMVLYLIQTFKKMFVSREELANIVPPSPSVTVEKYAVGDIFITTRNGNPSSLLGYGTWEQIKDSFLLAAGDTYSQGDTGGEATHTLTVAEMPAHTHTAHSVRTTTSTSGPVAMRNINLSDSADGVATPEVSSAGGGQAHNNMPPFLAVNMWIRTA